MTAYLIRRIGTSIVILIGISIFVFILLHSVFPHPPSWSSGRRQPRGRSRSGMRSTDR